MSTHAAWAAFFDAQEARLQEFRAEHAFDEEQENILGLLAESHRLCARSWRDKTTGADGEDKDDTGSSGKPKLLRESTMTESEDTEHDSIPWQDRVHPRLSTGSPAHISYASYSLSSMSASEMYAEYSVERLNDMSPDATPSPRLEKIVENEKPLKVFRKTPIAPRAPPASDSGKTSSSEQQCAAARHSPEGDRCESKAPWRDIMRQQRLQYNKKQSEPTPCQGGAVRRS